MFRLRSKSGDESVFRTPEEIRAALLSGFVTPDAQIWDAVLKGWVPLLEHALYQQIAATPGGRKSNAVKAPPASPTTAKPVPKLVIRRPGETAPPAAPAAPTPPPPPAPKAPVDEGPELVMLDVDLSFEPEPTPEPVPPPAPVAPPVAKRPTPPPAPAPPAPAPPPPPRVSAPRNVPPAPRVSVPAPAMRGMESMAESEGGSKKGLIIAAVVILAAAGGGFAMLRGKGADAAALPDSAAVVAPVAIVDSAPDSTARVADSTRADSTPVATAPVDTATPLPAAPVLADTLSAAPAIPGVAFAPPIERGPTSWNARPATAQPLSIPELEAVRLRYVSAQARALEQFEAGLEATGFVDMFDPSRIGRQDRREESLEAVEAGREALTNFRRRQAAIDFAYSDTLRQALPAGSDAPDLRTFGPILRENATQTAVTDSLLTGMNDIYTLLVNSPGGFTFRTRELFFKDAAKADEYRVLQERLTAQLGRLRGRPAADIPPAMGAILRGIGLPR